MDRNSSNYLFVIYNPLNPILFSGLGIFLQSRNHVNIRSFIYSYIIGMTLVTLYSMNHEYRRVKLNNIVGWKRYIAVGVSFMMGSFNILVGSTIMLLYEYSFRS